MNYAEKKIYVLHNIFADFCHILLILIDLEAFELVGVSSSPIWVKISLNSRISIPETILPASKIVSVVNIDSHEKFTKVRRVPVKGFVNESIFFPIKGSKKGLLEY